MKIFKAIYSIKVNETKVKIINDFFFKKYSKRCLIIYNNKKYPVQKELHITKTERELLKIKIICYNNKLNTKIITKGCESLIDSKEKEINRRKEWENKIILFDFITCFKVVYKIISKKGLIKIFGERFVANNIGNYLIQYKNKIFFLQEYFSIKDIIEQYENKLELILYELKNVTNRSSMFLKCDLLESFSSFEDINEELKGKFIKEESIIKIEREKSNELLYPKSSSNGKENEKNNDNLSSSDNIFEKSSRFSSNLNILKWITCNCTDMSLMFCGCSSLISLPDLSKWNTQNVTNMLGLFCGCKSLQSLPDLSKWNTQNVTNLSFLFCGCISLITLPDISKWNISNVLNMSSIFSGNSLYILLFGLSPKETIIRNDILDIKYECSSLISLPDISKWNTEKVINMSFLFMGCISLKSLPDISKWNTKNVKDMSFLLSE